MGTLTFAYYMVWTNAQGCQRYRQVMVNDTL